MLAHELFAKALQILEICVSVNNNLCRKLVLSLESSIEFDERFKVTSVSFSIPDFSLLSWEFWECWELGILHLKCCVV